MPVLADKQELFYFNTVLTLHIVWKICYERCMKGTERDRERERRERERESQGNPCCQSVLIVIKVKE